MPFDFQTPLPTVAHDGSYGHASTANRVALAASAAASDRLGLLEAASPPARAQVDNLLALARRGLPRMHRDGIFGQTLRAVQDKTGWTERLEGNSLRYLSMVALGLSCTDISTQKEILGQKTAADLARAAIPRAEASDDAGAVALAAWAAAEVGHFHATSLFRALGVHLASGRPIPTVDCAWALTAALAARHLGGTQDVIELSRDKLLAGRSPAGLFPHILPAAASGRMRSHIGSFADQVYPIQAFARYHVAFGDASALSLAEACAMRICALQGEHGQWWWHYDTRDGSVAEGYPVYSVHQHAMAPMVLLELREAGGRDHLPAILKGLRWLDEHPEVVETLVVPEKGVVWRKVGRREPRKAVRAMAAITTSLSPGLHMPAIDTLFPPSRVDHECRPYELGWLLYACLSGGVVERLAPAAV